MEFVANQGMDALITVARDADATFQQYILKGIITIVRESRREREENNVHVVSISY